MSDAMVVVLEALRNLDLQLDVGIAAGEKNCEIASHLLEVALDEINASL